HFKKAKLMEELDSKRVANDMLLTGETQIQTCETQGPLLCNFLAPASGGWSPAKRRFKLVNHRSNAGQASNQLLGNC
ncbi:hypothetical protein HAX54_038499, partial [Datura stramonium]|nr:hypothetical protein [Datura stramonium]